MKKQAWWFILMGAAAGMFAGFFGVGGGVIVVLMLVGILKMEQHQAHGTSLAIIPLVGLFGATRYALLGHMDLALAVLIALGSIVGVVIGAKVMARVPAKQLRQIFGIFLLIAGLRMLIWGT